MMLICAWPSAGPTGGAGVALPASICNLTDVCTFFGAICSLFYENLYFLLERRRSRLRESLLNFVAQALLPVLEDLLRRYLFDLPELKFHRGRAAKDRHHHFQGLAIFV